jgi:AcrR family transcriptional regulator
MERRRARTDDAKASRRVDILEAARATLDASELAEFTMDAVAGKLGLAKGTLYRYFPTREGLLLAILEGELDEWFDAVDRRLAAACGRAPVATALVGTLVARPRLLRLLAVLPSVLEHNVPFATAHEFKAFLLRRSAHTGALIDSALPARSRGAGVHLLVQLNAGVIGLYHGAHPAPIVATVLAGPEFAALRVDLRRELTHLTRALIGAIPCKELPS